jgi:hypothetical protein
MDGSPLPRPSEELPLWRRALPFVVGGGLITYVVSRLHFALFFEALRSIHYGAFLAFVFAFNGALLATDALATAAAYRRMLGPVRYWDLFVVRGASYLPSIVNHHVGQAWLTYLLSKIYRAPLWRVAGATLVVYATTFGALYTFLLLGLVLGDRPLPWLERLAVVIGVLGLLFLGVVKSRPAFLTRNQMTAPLAEIGVRGHLRLLLYRLPHMAVQFVGAWAPFWFFGVDIPVEDALALMPIIMFVVALPVSPQGLGTRDALAIALISHYATGSAEQRTATIAAATLSWLCALTLVQLVTSPLFLRRAYRLLGVEAARGFAAKDTAVSPVELR